MVHSAICNLEIWEADEEDSAFSELMGLLNDEVESRDLINRDDTIKIGCIISTPLSREVSNLKKTYCRYVSNKNVRK